jgi:putative tryptophan/tyrosine transport system substrate-binding protein
MRRRELMLMLTGAMAAPRALRAQQRPMPVIGFLSSLSASDQKKITAAFRQGLHNAGYVEGQNVAIEYRWADAQYNRLPAMAAEPGSRPQARSAKVCTKHVPTMTSKE